MDAPVAPFRRAFDTARDPHAAKNALGILDPIGNVSNSGTPVAGQWAQWVDATHIKGANPKLGRTDASAVPSGEIGEYYFADFLNWSPLGAATWYAALTWAVPPGDWDLFANLHGATDQAYRQFYCAISTLNTGPDTIHDGVLVSGVGGPGSDCYLGPARRRFNVSVSTTIYVCVYCDATTSGWNASTVLTARRMS